MVNKKKCKQCQEIYKKKVTESKKVWLKKKYCSLKCYSLWLKKNPTGFKKGHKHSPEVLKKLSEATKRNPQRYWKGKKLPKHVVEARTGKNHWAWKGSKVSKKQLHSWLIKHYGRPSKCKHCGKINNMEGKSILDWANISGKYKRTINDFMPLCRKCHVAYDKPKQLYG